MSPSGPLPTVAIAGGGLAGLAAGCALAEAGFRVSLFERRPYLGGRASSYQHPGTGEVVDNCQHVLLGCCTNLIDFYRRLGVEDRIRWYGRLTFVEPGGRQSVIAPSSLPAPFHTTPAFLRFHALRLKDKLAVARALLAIVNSPPQDSGPSFLEWLRAHGQTEAAIERFWKTILVSALNEELDRVSCRYAALVFRQSFLNSEQAGRMGVPSVPLSDLYGAAGDFILSRGGQVHLRSSVEALRADEHGASLCLGGSEVSADYVLLALPFQAVSPVLPSGAEAQPLRNMLERFESSPITGIHLWFDREVTPLDHAVLLDRTLQWMFNKSRIHRGRAEEGKSYLELVVSASKSLREQSRTELIDMALRELREFFPDSANAKPLKATVIKEVHATYAPLPGADQYRPGAESPWPRVFLAGDWTATGWPATMEGAVRSGYQAAEALAKAAGAPRRFLVPDLPPAGFMRLLAR